MSGGQDIQPARQESGTQETQPGNLDAYLIWGGCSPREGQRPSKLGTTLGDVTPALSVYERSPVDVAAMAFGGDVAGRFFNEVVRYLGNTDRGGQRILRLSLTMPAWERDPERLRIAAQNFAYSVTQSAADAVWLALDVTKEGRGHLYGVALSNQPSEWFTSTWLMLTGASSEGCSVKPVTGQKHGWGGDAKASAKLSRNLSAVLHYGLKSLPPRYDLPIRERVIVTGCLCVLWEQTCAELTPPTACEQSVAPNGSLTARCCHRCGDRLRAKSRRHALWCSPSCRTMAYEERRRVRAQLSADELDAFEERAAIIEYDAGFGRTKAEQQAVDQLRKPATTSKARPSSVASPHPWIV